MATIINLTRVNVRDGEKAKLSAPIEFDIEYQVYEDVEKGKTTRRRIKINFINFTNFTFFADVVFKVIYVGSAESYSHDQVLDEVAVGPISTGQYRFTLETDAPDFSKIPADDVVGVTVLILSCFYEEKELCRVGYYVTNAYEDEALIENPPDEPQFDLLHRSIDVDHPRVTRFGA